MIFYIIFHKYRFHSAIMHPFCIVCSAGFELIILIYIGYIFLISYCTRLTTCKFNQTG